jgi:hypothetical protein
MLEVRPWRTCLEDIPVGDVLDVAVPFLEGWYPDPGLYVREAGSEGGAR